MANGYRGMKTEHNGAKNGGGFWGKRNEAKSASDHRRRVKDRMLEKYHEGNTREPVVYSSSNQSYYDEWCD